VLTPKAVIEVLAADAQNRRWRDAGHDGQPLDRVELGRLESGMPYSWMTSGSYQFFCELQLCISDQKI
jgi:hypothetical protein